MAEGIHNSVIGSSQNEEVQRPYWLAFGHQTAEHIVNAVSYPFEAAQEIYQEKIQDSSYHLQVNVARLAASPEIWQNPKHLLNLGGDLATRFLRMPYDVIVHNTKLSFQLIGGLLSLGATYSPAFGGRIQYQTAVQSGASDAQLGELASDIVFHSASLAALPTMFFSPASAGEAGSVATGAAARVQKVSFQLPQWSGLNPNIFGGGGQLALAGAGVEVTQASAGVGAGLLGVRSLPVLMNAANPGAAGAFDDVAVGSSSSAQGRTGDDLTLKPQFSEFKFGLAQFWERLGLSQKAARIYEEIGLYCEAADIYLRTERMDNLFSCLKRMNSSERSAWLGKQRISSSAPESALYNPSASSSPFSTEIYTNGQKTIRSSDMMVGRRYEFFLHEESMMAEGTYLGTTSNGAFVFEFMGQLFEVPFGLVQNFHPI